MTKDTEAEIFRQVGNRENQDLEKEYYRILLESPFGNCTVGRR
jgi:hypothetical protein